MTRGPAGMIVLFALAGLAVAPPEARAVAQWQRYEIEIKTPVAYHQGNPYRDLQLRAYWSTTPQSSDPANPSGFGFWDGTRVENGQTYNIFKIRTALPRGTYHLWYKCSGTTANLNCGADPVLNRTAQSATSFQITANTQTGNPLYTNGFLQVPARQRYITYTGKPSVRFNWRGDTAWPAPAREGVQMLQNRAANPQTPFGAVTGTWSTYIDDRAQSKKGYTVVLVAPAVSWLPRTEEVQKQGCPRAGKSVEWDAARPPFPSPETFAFEQISNVGCSGAIPNNCSRWRPDYWREVDAMVEYANKKGIVIVMAGVADPSDRGHCRLSQDYPRTEDSVVFARNLAARLAGNHVIFSINFDDYADAVLDADGLWPGTVHDTAIAVGPELRRVVPRHLVTNHQAGSAKIADYIRYQNQPWLSFQLYQSGHSLNVDIACPDQPSTWQGKQKCAIGRALEFTKTLRAQTSIKPVVNGEGPYERPELTNTPKDLPPDNRYGMRHAAYASLLTGSAGFTAGVHGEQDQRSIISWVEPTHSNLLQSPGIPDLTRLDNFLKTLYPAAATGWGDFSAVDGLLKEAPLSVAAPGERRVIVGKEGNNYLAYLPNNPGVQVTSNFRGFDCGTWKVEWRDPKGEEKAVTVCQKGSPLRTSFARPVPCADPVRGDQKGACDLLLFLQAPQGKSAQMSLSGSYVTAWLAGDSVDGAPLSHQMTSQLVSAEGTPIGSELVLSIEGESDTYGIPTVVEEPFAGASWVVWEAGNSEEGAADILARRIGTDGTPLADAFLVNEQTGLRQYDPFTITDLAGNITVVWVRDVTEEEASEPRTDILARRFRADGVPLGDEFVVNSTPGEAQQDSPVVGADAAGNLVVGWRRDQELLFRLFAPTGSPRSEEIRVKGEFAHMEDLDVDLAELVVDPLGSFVVRWTEFWEPGESGIVYWYSRSFDTAGTPLSGIILEAPTTGDAEEL